MRNAPDDCWQASAGSTELCTPCAVSEESREADDYTSEAPGIDDAPVGSSMTTGHVACLCANVLFGGWNIVAQYGLLHGISPLALVTARAGLGSTLLFGLLFTFETWPHEAIVRSWAWLLLLGFCTFGVAFMYMLGASRTNAQTAGAMQCGSPVIGCLLPALMGTEQLTWLRIAAGFLAGGSTLVIALQEPSGDHADVQSQLYGVFYFGFEQIGIVVMAMVQKRVMHEFTSLALTTIQVAISVVFCGFSLLVVAFFVTKNDHWESLLTHVGMLTIGYGVVIITVIGLLLKTIGNSNLRTSSVMVYQALQPVVTLFLASYFLQEPVTLLSMLGTGGALASLGLVIVEQKQSSPVSSGYAPVGTFDAAEAR